MDMHLLARSGSTRACGVVVALALLAAACGDDSDGGDGSPAVAGDPAMCVHFESDTPGPDFVETVPAQYRSLAQAVVDLESDDIDLFGDGPAGDVGIVEVLSRDGAAEEFSGFADVVAATCPDADAAEGLRGFATMAEIGNAAPADDYCELLSASLDDDGADGVPDELRASAPSEHAQAYEVIEQIDSGDLEVLAQVGPALGGLGLYLERQCGQDDAFIEFFIIGAFASAFASEGGGGGGPAVDPMTEPGDVDLAPVRAALPAGTAIDFETPSFALQEDGDFILRAAVPEGWEMSDSFFGVSFEPPADADFSIFTELSFDAGCDGLCQTTDWEARLTGPDGFLTRTRDQGEFLRDEPLADGVLLISDGFAGGIDGRVLRWNDEAERYLSCEFELDEDEADLVDTFVAICTTAVPGWFPAG